MKDFINNSA